MELLEADLPQGIANDWPRNEVNPATMCSGTTQGYSDYPAYQE